jgi:hypothetical protein
VIDEHADTHGVLAEPRPLLTATNAADDRLAVLPVLYHLMWRHVITAELQTEPLGPGTLVSLARPLASS